jgi:hypothetical protein
MPLQARMALEVGTRAWLRIYWGADDCPSCLGGGEPGYHDARVRLVDAAEVGVKGLGGEARDHAGDPRWPVRCDHCGAPATPLAVRQVFRGRLYDTPSGDLEPGCLYWADWLHRDDGICARGWSNCRGPHLMAILPNGRSWDIDSRASNCALPEDTVHRCWVREGVLPIITVGKGGLTCGAGGGSIQVAGYHGFLRDGVFT